MLKYYYAVDSCYNLAIAEVYTIFQPFQNWELKKRDQDAGKRAARNIAGRKQHARTSFTLAYGLDLCSGARLRVICNIPGLRFGLLCQVLVNPPANDSTQEDRHGVLNRNVDADGECER